MIKKNIENDSSFNNMYIYYHFYQTASDSMHERVLDTDPSQYNLKG